MFAPQKQKNMKLINKIFLGICVLSLLTIVSCQKSDDGGPSAPANPGVFTGTYNPLDGTTSDWIASSTKAVHDTIYESLTITAQNAAGDFITILLSDTATGYYTLFQNTFNQSTYESATLDTIVTTVSNDVPDGTGPNQSTIQITDNGMSDGRIKGIVQILQWYIVGDGTADDERVAILQDGEFDIPLTRVGMDIGGGDGEMELSAKIDGAPFNPSSSTIYAIGLMLTGSDLTTGQTIIVQLPTGTTTGSHTVDSSSGYSVTFTDGETGYLSEGTINITSFDSSSQSAAGTFEVTATPMGGGDSVSITEGSFSF